MKRKYNLLLVFFFICPFSFGQTDFPIAESAQGKYWIQFIDKDTVGYNYKNNLSPTAIENRERLNIPLEQWTDIPLNNNYLQAIQAASIQVVSQSKWLNSVSANLSQSQIEWLKKQDFVQKITLIDVFFQALEEDPDYDGLSYTTALSQMEPGVFELEKLTGKGVIVGVIDAGFYSAHKRKSLSGIFINNQILGSRDFVEPNQKDLFNTAQGYADGHGSRVLEMIAGERISNTKKYGFATDASFYLARTDDGNNEFRGEEDYWVAAMEWMDSLGVRIINTSLGYALGFDNPEENYQPSDMDGKTTMITKASNIAVNEKGLLLVVSAGNEGGDPDWRIVSAPADSEGVISVGATNQYGGRASYSSMGPVTLPYLKPNISCYSGDGTSFSAPVIAGFAACLMQKNPYATNKQIAHIIEQSGHLYPFGNNYIGYGIPKSTRAINMMNGKEPKSLLSEVKAIGKEYVLLKLDKEMDVSHAIVFHKNNSRHVRIQGWARISKGRIKLKKPKNTKISTVIISDEVGFEVVWEE